MNNCAQDAQKPDEYNKPETLKHASILDVDYYFMYIIIFHA